MPMTENLTERLPKKFEKLSSFFEILRIFKWIEKIQSYYYYYSNLDNFDCRLTYC